MVTNFVLVILQDKKQDQAGALLLACTISILKNIIKNKLQVEIGPRRPNDIAVSIANSDKFKKEFNWKPRFNNLNYILRSALEWEKIN